MELSGEMATSRTGLAWLSVNMDVPSLVRHTCKLRDAPPPTNNLPLGEYDNAVMFTYSGIFNSGFQEPVEKIQIAACSVCRSSSPPTASVCPSGEKLTLPTWSGKSNVFSKSPLRQSQILAVPSLETDASSRSSGENARLQTMPLCPPNVPISFPLATSHTWMAKSVVSPPAPARTDPSEVKARPRTLSGSARLSKISSMLIVSTWMGMSVGVTEGRLSVGGTAVAVNGTDVCVAVGPEA